MKSQSFAAAAALLAVTATAAPTPDTYSFSKRLDKFDFSTQTIRGVNLGGWLLAEPFISPSLFAPYESLGVADEWTYGQYVDKATAQANFEQHWATWITQDDLTAIAAAGMNFVRIPVGYWSINPSEGDPYVFGAYEYLGKALDWAQAAGLHVMIDLHGAPGSQNGFDNSGRRGDINWSKQEGTIKQTLAALQKIADDHASHPAVATIELLNEPFGPSLDVDVIKQFYLDGWNIVHDAGLPTTIHDAFQNVTSWNGFGNPEKSFVLDTHHYEVFDNNQLQLSTDEHIASVCALGEQMASNDKTRTFCGEFSAALTDCVKWLNGVGKGARYDGTFENSTFIGSCDGGYNGKVSDLSAEYQDAISRYVSAQFDSYERNAGWMFWNWKTESAPEWNMQELLAAGIIATPVTARAQPNQCSGGGSSKPTVQPPSY